MEAMMGVSSVVFGVFCLLNIVIGQEQCNGELWCEQGHCCGSDGTHCCTYYYELWWFWMIWGLIIMLSCCCLYQQHRLKKRQRRALRALQNGLRDGTYAGRPVFGADGRINSFVESYSESQFRLPTYDEVQVLPKDPPSYEVLFESGRSRHGPAMPTASGADARESRVPLTASALMDHSTRMVDDSDDVGLLDNEAVPEEDLPPAYSAPHSATSPTSLP